MSKKYSNIDDLFRDKLKDFEVDPPGYVWEKVREKMPKKQAGGKQKPFRNGGMAGTALILILTGVISFSLINGPSKTVEAIPEQEEEKTLFADHQTDHSGAVVTRGIDPPENKKKERKDKKPEKRVKASDPSKNATLYIEPVVTGELPDARRAKSSLLVQPMQGYTVSTTGQPVTDVPDIEPRDQNTGTEPVADSRQGENDEILRINAANDFSGSGTVSNYTLENRWTASLFYTPEMILYPSDDQMKNYSQSLDILVSYTPGNYFLQTGLGLAQYRDQGNRIINYNKYIGSYEDVYNVTFDSTTNGVTPIYHTETVHVYDSVTHVTISPSKRKFTYLQVPLFIGYGEMYKRFGWSVKCGPSISFLIHEEDPGGENTMMQARILGVENELPGRIQTHWQFVLSAGLSYKLGNTINLNVEPLFRYYIRSAYENNTLNTRHPWSAGLRTGVSFRF